MSHSPEPWKMTDRGIVDADNCDVTGLRGECDDAMPSTLHDQCRIVACVNALAGVPTEILESGDNGAIIRALADLMAGSLADAVMDSLEDDNDDISVSIYKDEDEVSLAFERKPSPFYIQMDVESAVKLGKALVSVKDESRPNYN